MSEPPTDVAVAGGDDQDTLQARLEATEAPAPAAPGSPVVDPVGLLRHLDVSGRFHRDSRLGRLYHRGMVSLRENVPTDSLHISVDDNHLAAHVDRVSPLTVERGASGYSLRRAMAHNAAGMVQDLLWVLRGRQGDHRCELDCEWIGPDAPVAVPLLDPSTSAWSVHLEARLDGRLDETRLRDALHTALGDRSLDRDPLEVVFCADDHALDAARTRLHGLPIDIVAFPPLHVCLARGPGGDVVMLNLNHAATDGFGAVVVMQAIAAAYAAADAAAEPLDFLAAGDLAVRPAAVQRSRAARIYSRLVEALRNARDRPARLAADDPGEDPGYGVHLVGLTAQETERLVDVGQARASTNVLLAALHLAIADWNGRHGVAGGRIGVLVAADLRPEGWDAHRIANLSVNARMSTRPADRREPTSALETITKQIQRNKRSRTGVALIAALDRANLIELWAKQSIVVLHPLTGNRRVDTTVLCNVGSVAAAPDFGPGVGGATELWLSTPARAPLSLCLGAVTVAGRLHLTFRYPRRLLSPDAARRFAECYLVHARQVAAARDACD